MSDEEAPFAFGEGTLMRLRQDPWQFDESATQMITPGLVASAVETPQAPPPAADPLARIEERLDEISRTMNALKKRLDSIDVALARVLTR